MEFTEPRVEPNQSSTLEPGRSRLTAVQPQVCPTCGTASEGQSAPSASTYIYAIGTIEPRFPSQGLEKEFAQAVARIDTRNLTDRQARHKVLSQRENRYLARHQCWVMKIQGLDTYILTPRDSADLGLLVEAVRPEPAPADVDVVIGIQGPIAAPSVCNGLVIPIVVFDQIYSFDRASLVNSLPRPEKTPAKEFQAGAEELLDRIMQLADNAGATDEHRALNYLAVRYDRIYSAVSEAHARNLALSAVDVVPSRLSGVRKIVDVVFSLTNRTSDVTEKQFVRVDVTEEFPFLVTKLSPYYDR